MGCGVGSEVWEWGVGMGSEEWVWGVRSGCGECGVQREVPQDSQQKLLPGNMSAQNESSLSCISLIRIGQEVVLREDSLWWTMDTSKPHYTVSPHYS